MLEFEDILRRYNIGNEKDIKSTENLEIKVMRSDIEKKVNEYWKSTKEILEVIKKSEEKEILLIKESISDSLTSRVYKRESDAIDNILVEFKSNKIIVGKSINKIKRISKELDKIKAFHIQEEKKIQKDFGNKCEKSVFNIKEIELLQSYIDSNGFKDMMNIKNLRIDN